jgi:hypothetical protein
MHKATSSILAAAAVVAFTATAHAQAPQAAKVGTLDCDISGGIGMIIASQKGVQCIYTPSVGGPQEVYVGTITKYGIDIGATAGGRMIWAVYAPTSAPPRGALAGTYAGASAEATVGAGAGANALVGGNNRTVTLQPLSVQGQTGLNLAVGVAGLSLNPAR